MFCTSPPGRKTRPAVRLDGSFIVRRPLHIAEIARKHPGLGRLRLVIDWVNQADTMTLKVEAPSPSPDLEKAMEGTIRTVCKVGGKVEFAKPGSLPNDGKVIDDVRKYT